MGGRPVIEGMLPVHVDFVHMNVILCIMHYLNVMPIAFCDEKWHARTAHQTLDLRVLLCTNLGMNTARQIVQNIRFVGAICQAADACEM